MKYSVILLAAGSGKRMGKDVPKQYLPLLGRPLLFYSLDAFEKSDVDEIILVVANGDEDYCKKEFVEAYGFTKVSAIISGGAERYDSVYAGLQHAKGDYVLIHDGARCFIDDDTIKRCLDMVEKTKACVAGVPAKDTIKVCNKDGVVCDTPDRSLLWQVQTPQCFERELITLAYKQAIENNLPGITDDAMVLEKTTGHPVQMILGSYNNIKVTTPEDLLFGEAILGDRKKV